MKTTLQNITKSKRFWHLKACLFLIIFTLLNAEVSLAQNKITSEDEKKIKSKASIIITKLASIYNTLLDSDSQDRKHVIDNMLLPGTESQIFVTDQVLIENDFATRSSLSDDKTIIVYKYFNDICSNYGKKDNGEYTNEGKLVSFTNITTSKVLAASPKDSLFIEVFFDVNYEGIDDRTKLAFKQPAHRVAEFTVEKIKNNWKLEIRSMRFLKGEIENDKKFEKNVIVIPVESKEDFKDLAIEKIEKVSQNPYLQAYKNEGKWGIVNVDDNYKILTKPTFDEIDEFTEDGLASVNIAGLWGYINLEGKIIINCEYDVADPFSKEKKGRARVYKGLENYLIDTNGNKTK